MRLASVVRLFLAVLVGVILGAWIFRPRPAQAQNQVAVEVKAVPGVIGGKDANAVIVNSQIVGFSCVPGTVDMPYPRCFVASIVNQGK